MRFMVGTMLLAGGVALAQPAEPTGHWVLGNFQRHFMQRITDDNGLSVFILEQRLGAVPIIFQKQHEAAAKHEPIPESGFEHEAGLLLAHGQFVTETVEIVTYEGPPGAMPNKFGKAQKSFTYFLADDAAKPCPAPVSSFNKGSGSLELRLDGACVPSDVSVRMSLDSSSALAATIDLKKGESSLLVLPVGQADPSMARLTIGNALDTFTEQELTPAAVAALPEGIVSIQLNPAFADRPGE